MKYSHKARAEKAEIQPLKKLGPFKKSLHTVHQHFYDTI